MPPQKHRTAPGAPSLTIPRRTRRAPARPQANTQESGEDFDLEDVYEPGDEPPDSPAAITPANEINADVILVNDPEMPPTSRKRKNAEDIHYFFEATKDRHLCKECK
jgi:hypothetical protein